MCCRASGRRSRAHWRPRPATVCDQPRQVVAHLARAEARDQRQPARLVLGVQLGHQDLQVLGRGRRPAFQADGVLHAAAEFDMRAVGLPRAVADPDHVARARDRQAGGRVDPRQRLFVFQQQRLVAGVEIDLGQRVRRVRVDPGRVHEVQRVADAVRHVAVLLGLRPARRSRAIQAWTRCMSAKPPVENARSRFSDAADCV